MRVGDICAKETIVISKGETIKTASRLMERYDVGSLVVVETDHKGSKPIGIITDRDIVVKVIADDLHNLDRLVENVMSKELLTVHEDESIYRVLESIRDKVVRRIPVLNSEGYLTGILTIDAILGFFGKEMGEVIRLFQIHAR